MTEAEARDQLRNILAALEVRRGGTVYLGIDMGHVPLPCYSAELTRDTIRAREEKWCAFVLRVLREALGPEGTLLVATFTYSYAGQGVPFVLEESPSEVGPFTEYFRRQPDTIRSLHPLHSISGVGRHAHAILDNVGKAEYGAMSPYARLGEYDTKLLCLGAALAASITYVHHLEQTYGINHRYTKAIDTPVYRNGERVPGPWLCFMRYLGVATMLRHEHIEERLRDLQENFEWTSEEVGELLRHVRSEAPLYTSDNAAWTQSSHGVDTRSILRDVEFANLLGLWLWRLEKMSTESSNLSAHLNRMLVLAAANNRP